MTRTILLALLLLQAAAAQAYPLYGSEDRRMPRLPFYHHQPQPNGARLPQEAVDIRLRGRNLAIPEPDPELTRDILGLLPAGEREAYSFAVLDITNPANPVYAEHRAGVPQFPGSVGKVVVALAVFQALADAFPAEADRLRVLREAWITADEYILTDSHDVPMVENDDIDWRPLRQGDSGNLWTWLDWMLSASSNAAASMVIKQAMLLERFGGAYPLPDQQASQAFAGTPPGQEAAWLRRALDGPVPRNGLNLDQLRQGSFFTARGKALAPTGGSTCTARELLNFLLRMEQGQLVDPFSSREIKRLLYVTQRRIRYASSPALEPAAVYFKSGSQWGCTAKAPGPCGEYMGNRINMMNSVAVVEAPATNPKATYLCVMLSNVLRRNSAVQHQTFGTLLQRLMEQRHGK